jgi:hypothetical protein
VPPSTLKKRWTMNSGQSEFSSFVTTCKLADGSGRARLTQSVKVNKAMPSTLLEC